METSRSERPAETEPGRTGRLFVHIEGDIIQTVAPLDDSLGNALRAAGVDVAEDAVVLTGHKAFRSEPEETDDDDAPVSLVIAVRGITGHNGHGHVVVHRCRQVAVSVHYQNRTIERRISPARTVADVRAWAIRRLGLQDEAATDKLVLEICDSDRRPRPDVRLTTLVSTACALCFDLVPDKIIEG